MNAKSIDGSKTNFSLSSLELFLIIFGFFSSQRFLFTEYFFIINIFSFVCYFIFFKNLNLRIFFLIISLFLYDSNHIDLPYIKYIIYMIIALEIFFKLKFKNFKLIFIFLIFSFYFLFSIISSFYNPFDISNFILFSILFFILIIIFAVSDIKDITYEPDLFNTFLIFYIIGEIINILFFSNNYVVEGYLSNNGSKIFIIFPFFYLYFCNKKILSFLFFFLILFVLIEYNSKFLIIFFIFSTIQAIIIKNLRINFLNSILLSIFFFVIVFLFFVFISNIIDFTGSQRIFTIFRTINSSETNSITELLYLNDNIRFSEIELYLKNLSFLNFLVGHGFGSGLNDNNLLMPAGSYEDYASAFSYEEFKSKTYFNLHGFHIEFLLRFGFIFTFFFFFLLFRLFDKSNLLDQHLSIFLFCLILIGYFNLKTIFIILIFMIYLKSKIKKLNI